ncbi:MAG: isoprenylcysteine carboxylmethyltransferase family protein [Alphaproteobacteria bacterium]|nr:isoprenylcysteine carboxylmethyltransferase family protein [Alphaproteobacteria bacterium]MBV9371462.1 isoprenylcysteine carboxylmethyltransferase family protein [Alphaproteobacteria bacterium]MBV9902399.1 isoprenylcysteine carboxylmethyltransferase family protein [Alphaproteobacteria bacterium]
MRLFEVQPAGLPGVAAFVVGGLLFFAILVRTLVMAGRAEAGEKRSGASRLGIGLQMAGFAAVGFGGLRIALLPASPPALAQAAAVAALMGGAILLFLAASRAMGANWSLAARMRADHQLVTGGVFARLRHPIYAGMALFLAAEAVGLGHYRHLLVGVPLFVAGTGLRVREEERLLRAQFGAAYEDYARRVKRFLPGIA